MKRFLLWILFIILGVIVLSLLYALGYMSATSNVSSFVQIVIGTIAFMYCRYKKLFAMESY